MNYCIFTLTPFTQSVMSHIPYLEKYEGSTPSQLGCLVVFVSTRRGLSRRKAKNSVHSGQSPSVEILLVLYGNYP